MTNYITKQYISELSLTQKLTGGGAILGSGLGIGRGVIGRIKINNEIKDLENKYKNSTDELQKRYYMTRIQNLKNDINDKYSGTKMVRDTIIGGTIGGALGYGTSKIISGGKNLKTKVDINSIVGRHINRYMDYSYRRFKIDDVKAIQSKSFTLGDLNSRMVFDAQIKNYKDFTNDVDFMKLYNDNKLIGKRGGLLKDYYDYLKELYAAGKHLI